jgi:hypothetical protein
MKFNEGYTDILQLITWSRVRLEELIVAQLLKKFPTFYGTRKFITVYTTARYIYLSSPRSCVTFRNMLFSYGGELLPLAQRQSWRTTLCCPFATTYSIAATLHIWRPFPSTATWRRVMPWWQGTHLTWVGIFCTRFKSVRLHIHIYVKKQILTVPLQDLY